MKIELRKLSTNQKLSEETNCFSADVYVDGVKAAEHSNYGHGGPDMVRVIDKEKYAEFEAWCKAQPPIPIGLGTDRTIEMNAELYVGELVEKMIQSKRLKRTCKGKTLFRVEGDKADMWRIVKEEFTPDVRKRIVTLCETKHPNKKVEFLNDLIVA